MSVEPNQELAFKISAWAEEVLQTNPLLIDKIVTNVSPESAGTVQNGLVETFRFLYLCSKANQSLTPSKRIDDIWHELILFTRTYHSFCHKELGQFVHHQPSNSPQNENIQYLNTLDLYKLHFGQPDIDYWPHCEALTSSCGHCET